MNRTSFITSSVLILIISYCGTFKGENQPAAAIRALGLVLMRLLVPINLLKVRHVLNALETAASLPQEWASAPTPASAAPLRVWRPRKRPDRRHGCRSIRTLSQTFTTGRFIGGSLRNGSGMPVLLLSVCACFYPILALAEN